MKKLELLQTLHNMYDECVQLHNDINNCIDINCEQVTDLTDSNYEIEEILRFMICTIEQRATRLYATYTTPYYVNRGFCYAWERVLISHSLGIFTN